MKIGTYPRSGFFQIKFEKPNIKLQVYFPICYYTNNIDSKRKTLLIKFDNTIVVQKEEDYLAIGVQLLGFGFGILKAK